MRRRFSKASRLQSWSAMGIDSAALSVDSGSSSSRPTSSSSSRPKSRSSQRNYDTGFPEPFCGSGNTTLRHPAANTSPDFCICASDVDVNRVYNRTRLFYFANKNKRTTISHGKLSAYGNYTNGPSAEYSYKDSDLLSITEASPPRTGSSSGRSFDSTDSSRLSSDGFDRPPRLSFDAAHRDHEMDVLTRQESSTVSVRPSTSHSIGGGSILRKLRRRD